MSSSFALMPVSNDIEIKPPIDLIADEYTRTGNNNIYVSVYCKNDDREAHDLIDYLGTLDFPRSVTNIDPDISDFDLDWIKTVQTEIKGKNCDGIILIIAKVYLQAEDMKKIWSQFTSNNCPELKNKPKIFIFQIGKRRVARDRSATDLNWLTSYETPPEADMLIIHDKYDEGRTDLLGQLCTSIEGYGERENIITLVSLSFEYNYQPLVISTMTRKFYFINNIHRGHHLDILTNQDLLKNNIEKIQLKLADKPKEAKPKKREESFIKVLKRRLSIKKKSRGKKEACEADGTSSQAHS